MEKSAVRIVSAFQNRGDSVTVLDKSFSRFPSLIRLELYDRYVQRDLKIHSYDIVFGMERNRFQTHYRAGNGVHAAFLESRRHAEGEFKYLICKYNPLHRKILELEKTAFEHPSLQKLITNSDLVKSQILHYYNVDEAKIEVIHNGVEWKEMEIDFQSWMQERGSTLQKYSLDPNRYHFLFVGNGYRRKGLGQLLKALERLSGEEFHLTVIGKDKHQNQFEALTAKIKDRVTFLGPQSQTIPFYQMADALVIPSFYDPFANVTLEALAMGLTVISSKSNGGSEILKDGIVIPDLLDIDSIVECLKKALRSPKQFERAAAIRNSVKTYDYSHHLQTLVQACG